MNTRPALPPGTRVEWTGNVQIVIPAKPKKVQR